ncbi:LacI family DNA-binding transcriptional regulator [Caballeronia humi]|uniref:LacI family transcription regulator n=1 Tax=Caballeronia humi TaxID=326474 RepID=A0A158INM4_9BURK|nr:LacI family DNA-binding transcriptional regulator [Caballeronia humi]SAL57809.1 LacI family transcription regulator [Caballeronia humi]
MKPFAIDDIFEKRRPREFRRPVTGHEVARSAGVSQSAVSRVFTPGASVSVQTRAKVLAAATKLGYRPNLIASSLITGRSRIVGVVVPGLRNPFYAALVDALSEALSGRDYRVMLFTAWHGTSADPILDEILRYRLDALILVSAELSSRLAEECGEVGLPVVMVNRKTDSEAVSSVTGDNRAGAACIGSFLLAGSHRRFVFMAGLDSSSTSRDREAGFRERLLQAGAVPPLKVHGSYTVEVASRATRELLKARTRPDAIFCANDQMAMAAMDVARSEFGLDVGRELSIVGFDDTQLAASPAYRLTTFSQPVEKMVDNAVAILVDACNGRDLSTGPHIVGGRLVVRDSARLPPRGLSQVGGRTVWTQSAKQSID